MFRKDILYGGSLYNIPEYKSNPRRYSRHLSAMQDEEKRALAAAAKLGEDKEVDKICGCIPASGEASKAFKEMMDLSLLRDVIFIIFAASNFLTSIGFNVPYVYVVDRAEKELNFSKKDASLLLSAVGIGNTVGRIVLGFISDRGWINRLYLYNICLAICGIAMGLSNFCLDYTTQVIFCAVFGITSGAYVGLTSVVLVDLLGLDKLTNAFGLLLLFQGIASVIGPPIIGWLYAGSGNYAHGFYFAGAMIFLSGIMLFAIPWLEKRKGDEEDLENEGNYNGAAAEGRIVEVDEDEIEDPDDAPMTMNA